MRRTDLTFPENSWNFSYESLILLKFFLRNTSTIHDLRAAEWEKAKIAQTFYTRKMSVFSGSSHEAEIETLTLGINLDICSWLTATSITSLKFCQNNTWNINHKLVSRLSSNALCEKCRNMEYFLVRIFLHSNRKNLRIWKLFTQWYYLGLQITGHHRWHEFHLHIISRPSNPNSPMKHLNKLILLILFLILGNWFY